LALASAVVMLAHQPRLAEARRAPSSGLAPIALDRPAPDFIFGTALGPSRLAELLEKPVVVNFWATWCEPCVDELSAFAALNTRYGDSVNLVTISDQSVDVARAFLKAHGVTSTVITDPSRKIFDLYGVSPIPVTLVLRPGGSVSYVSIGEVGTDELDGAVGAALVRLPKPASGPGRAPGNG
jgi:peroxiredoxin